MFLNKKQIIFILILIIVVLINTLETLGLKKYQGRKIFYLIFEKLK